MPVLEAQPSLLDGFASSLKGETEAHAWQGTEFGSPILMSVVFATPGTEVDPSSYAPTQRILDEYQVRYTGVLLAAEIQEYHDTMVSASAKLDNEQLMEGAL